MPWMLGIGIGRLDRRLDRLCGEPEGAIFLGRPDGRCFVFALPAWPARKHCVFATPARPQNAFFCFVGLSGGAVILKLAGPQTLCVCYTGFLLIKASRDKKWLFYNYGSRLCRRSG